MTANLSITVETKKNIIMVPNLALGFQPALSQDQYRKFIGKYGKNFDLKNKTMVWTIEKGQNIEPLFVNPGLSDGFVTEIKDSTLKENAPVIIGIIRGSGAGGYDFAKKK